MRVPTKVAVLLAVVVLASFSVAVGQEPAVYVDVSEVQGLTPAGEIPAAGTNLVIPVRFVNPDYNQTAISNGYRFYGSYDNINSVWNPAYPWDLTHALALMQFPMYFDMALATCYILPDLAQTAVTEDAIGVGHAGISGTQGVGLPAGFNDVAYNITLTNVTGELTMDTTWWKPANYWIWIAVPDPGPDWGGPYVFPAEGGGEAPVITSEPVLTGQVDELYTYNVDATGDPVPTYELIVFPEGMTIDPATGIITWTPTAAGTFPVTVRATNTEGNDDQSFSIEVIPAYTLPVFTSEPVLTGEVGQLYTYDADADGYPTPTYSLTTKPSGMNINGTTGEITWTPTAAGSFNVTVVASNLAGDTPQPYVITVYPTPTAPVIVAIDDQTANLDANFSYDVNVEAGCYPAPTFSLTTAPATMDIDPVSGLITWKVDETGVIDVTVRAENTAGFDTESFTITVSETCPPYTTFLWPEATINMGALYDPDRVMQFGIWCESRDILLESIRVFNIPPYYPAHDTTIGGTDLIVTYAFVMRFLGAGGFRPLPSDGYTGEEYPLYYTCGDGTEVTLTGTFSLNTKVGDVTFDDMVNIDDVVFMTEFFFNGGPTATWCGEKVEEFMDINQDGRIDLIDVRALIEIANI